MEAKKRTPFEPGCYISLSELNEQLATCTVSAKQLELLGFKSTKGAELCKLVDDPLFARKYRSATLYKTADVPNIRAAIARAMGCADGEAHTTGQLLAQAPDQLPAGYSLSLTASPAGHLLHLSHPDGVCTKVDCNPPLSAAIRSAIACAQAHSATQGAQA